MEAWAWPAARPWQTLTLEPARSWFPHRHSKELQPSGLLGGVCGAGLASAISSSRHSYRDRLTGLCGPAGPYRTILVSLLSLFLVLNCVCLISIFVCAQMCVPVCSHAGQRMMSGVFLSSSQPFLVR